mmetsp:Transcript_66016/g.155451  ORF Transcript_66016/g.155451 Transcript_66016/m.155451 type:complete len:297 (+) Transcript_66016:70-960(+)
MPPDSILLAADSSGFLREGACKQRNGPPSFRGRTSALDMVVAVPVQVKENSLVHLLGCGVCRVERLHLAVVGAILANHVMPTGVVMMINQLLCQRVLEDINADDDSAVSHVLLVCHGPQLAGASEELCEDAQGVQGVSSPSLLHHGRRVVQKESWASLGAGHLAKRLIVHACQGQLVAEHIQVVTIELTERPEDFPPVSLGHDHETHLCDGRRVRRHRSELLVAIYPAPLKVILVHLRLRFGPQIPNHWKGVHETGQDVLWKLKHKLLAALKREGFGSGKICKPVDEVEGHFLRCL